MADQSSERDPYLAEHVREAIAHDPRVGELGVNVEISGETVVLAGTLRSAQRQEAASEVAHDLLPDHEVRNETVVESDYPEPADTDAEHLA